MDGKAILEFFSSFDYMSSLDLYTAKFRTIIDKINSDVAKWQSYTSQVSPQASGSEYNMHVDPLVGQIKANILDLVSLRRQFDLQIENEASKVNLAARHSSELMSENSKLEDQQNPESSQNQTAKGLYEEERNIYNLKLTEIVLYNHKTNEMQRPAAS